MQLVDRQLIEQSITLDSFFNLGVINGYFPDGDPVQVINIADWDSDYIEAFKKVIDAVTFAVHENALVWKITETSKTFNLENSYVRDGLSTAGTLTALDDNTQIKARFEVPGFLGPTLVEIDVWYNAPFNPADIASLAAVGIAITGDGKAFTVANKTEFKLSFFKPTGAASNYVIYCPFRNKIFT